jgi:dTDP-4-dehydrorhamnose reductase
MHPLQMWGGLECTLNRVGDEYISQSVKNGHSTRMSDLQLFSDLGIKKIRYPCLWEMVAPEEPGSRDWSWVDERLTEIKRLGLTPIAGFLHHGSGPKYTSLIDDHFPELLAEYARAFAERYPWVEDFTPINEILTTARFSCLYGHWYPHHATDASFLKAVILQCKATVLAMKEIKKINPRARLIQTDDIGECQSTELLTYQRDFENERRWLAYDFLCGKVNKKHPLYKYLKKSGVTDEEINWFHTNHYAPDIIGLNHYHLSNRFLDEHLERNPAWSHGGNGKHQYADVGAIDTGVVELPSPTKIMKDCWDRFGLPIAITEVHTRGNREEQMRWLYQIWNNAQEARAVGIEMVAITSWSLLGTYDWHKLCTTNEMFYESGVYDLRSIDGSPRSTGLSKLVQELATRGSSSNPLLLDQGSWLTPRRILWAAQPGSFTPITREKTRPILIYGSNTLSRAFGRICGQRNLNYRMMSSESINVLQLTSIIEAFKQINPWAVVNTSGHDNVDEAENDHDRCFREHVEGPGNLAIICTQLNIPMMTFSTDLVFDGTQDLPYMESHLKSPLSVYGTTKAQGEDKVLLNHAKPLVIRTGSIFGPWDEENFVTRTLEHLSRKLEVHVADDVKLSPTYLPDLVNTSLDLLIDGEDGIFHLCNKGEISWAGLANIVADAFQVEDRSLIKARNFADLNFRARRPRNRVLASERYSALPPLENALDRYFNDIRSY